jgi:CHAD domain-containing protein
VTLDRVEVLEDRRMVARFCEVEAELTNGSADFGAIKRRLKNAGARATDGRSKLHRALETLDLAPAPRKLPKPSAPATDLFRSYLARQLDELTAHDPAVRVGGDPEDVHDMRVAVRRLRTALKTAKPMLDQAWVDELRAELGWLADSLAPVRDLDVLIEYLDQEIATLDAGDAVTGQHLLSPLRERRRSAEEKLKQTLDSDRYLDLLDRIEAASQTLPTCRADLDFDKRARKQYRKLTRQVASLGDEPSAAALHQTRIRAKRVRYATELAAGNDNGHRKALSKALKTLQDTLGTHHDAVFAERELRSLTRLVPPETALVIGRLVERQHHRRTAARAAFRSDWKRVKRQKP